MRSSLASCLITLLIAGIAAGAPLAKNLKNERSLSISSRDNQRLHYRNLSLARRQENENENHDDLYDSGEWEKYLQSQAKANENEGDKQEPVQSSTTNDESEANDEEHNGTHWEPKLNEAMNSVDMWD